MKSNPINKNKFKHILVTYQNFEKLRRYGYAGDSLNDVITRILESGSEVETAPNLKEMLEKKKMVESGSRVGEFAKF